MDLARAFHPAPEHRDVVPAPFLRAGQYIPAGNPLKDRLDAGNGPMVQSGRFSDDLRDRLPASGGPAKVKRMLAADVPLADYVLVRAFAARTKQTLAAVVREALQPLIERLRAEETH